MSKGKKRGIAIAAVLVVIAAAACLIWWIYFRNGGSNPAANNDAATVYVDNVGMITGTNISGDTKFAGAVEAQKTVDVTSDSSKKLKTVFVEAGQEIKEGDALFEYDVDDILLSLESANLELDYQKKTVADAEADLANWQKQTKQDTTDYILGLEKRQLAVRKANYDLTIKQNQVNQIQASLENSTVYATVDGTVKSVNTNSDDYSKPLISIMQSGNYRVKCKVSEIAIQSLYVGMPVTAISRVNEDETWSGVIDQIDRNSTVDNGNRIDYGTGDSMSSSSYYYFYVTLDSYENLILGQHVFVETGDLTDVKTGLWLPEYFLVQDGDGAYVWASENNVIRKRSVTLGSYDEMMSEYEILDGLTTDDYIAYPDDTIEEGAPAVSYSDALIGGAIE